jgi:hypothetical protein
MKTPTCLYHRDGTTVTVDATEVADYVAQGYADTPDAFIEVDIADDAPPTREELEQKAQELGIKFDGRTSDAKLEKLINEAA